jgi:hypothetical protein
MLKEGTIIHFNLFQFKNPSASPKSKYFIVVKNINNLTVLASLPSSQKHLPFDLQSTYGCIELPESGIGCYAFKANEPIATNGFGFPLDSYLYGQHIDEYDLDNIFEIHPFEGIDYQIKGEILEEKLKDIIDCLKSSTAVKRKFKRFLS